jgi:hypothetical protein
LSIFPNKDAARLSGPVKRQFLYSLIGEKLLAAEAGRMNLVREERFKRNAAIAEEMFVRDKLYRDTIRARVSVSEKDIQTRFKQLSRSVEYQFLFSDTREKIDSFDRLIKSGMPFDTLLAAQRMDASSMNNGSTSGLDKELESSLKKLRPGQVTSPLKTSSGWYIIQRIDAESVFSADEYIHMHKTLEVEVRREKEAEAAKAFVKSIWKGKSAVISDTAIRKTGQAMLVYLRRQASSDTTETLSVPSEVYDKLRSDLGVRMLEPFASIGKASISTGEMIDRMEFRNLRIRRSDIRRFVNIFNDFVHEMLDAWVLTMEGYRRNLQNTPDVRRDMAMWTENGMAQSVPEILWEQFVADDDSLWNFYIEHMKLFGLPPEVRIASINGTDTVALRKVVEDSRAGRSIESRVRSGEAVSTGWFPVTMRGAVGRRAFVHLLGDPCGPMRDSVDWIVFEVIDRRYPADSTVHSMAGIKEFLEGRYRSGITYRKLTELTTRLAKDAAIEVDEDVFNSIEATPMQMFTVRQMGFGGRIPAAPGVLPLFEAVIEGMSQKSAPKP